VAVASIGSFNLAAIPTEMITAQGLHLRGILQKPKAGLTP